MVTAEQRAELRSFIERFERYLSFWTERMPAHCDRHGGPEPAIGRQYALFMVRTYPSYQAAYAWYYLCPSLDALPDEEAMQDIVETLGGLPAAYSKIDEYFPDPWPHYGVRMEDCPAFWANINMIRRLHRRRA